jgi:hypothetical protein
VASGVGAALIVWQCGVGTACGNDAYDAFAVPLAILTPAFLIGGIGMMAWSRPASSSVSVMPVDAPLARRSSPLRFRLGAVPVHGGAAVALGAAF